jgi:hypothetical protein
VKEDMSSAYSRSSGEFIHFHAISLILSFISSRSYPELVGIIEETRDNPA